MAQKSTSDLQQRPKVSADWLVRGTLTKIGDIFDRLTGRGYKPSSTLATSELIERMKFLLDSEAHDENGRKFVPHNIKLKMQWDKFSTDAEDSLRDLENEFLTAAVDHVNDKRYYTREPFNVEAKPDYFTQGVKLFVSFDRFADDDAEAAINVPVPSATNEAIRTTSSASDAIARVITIRYSLGGTPVEKQLTTNEGERLSVGRTKENHISIDDPSLSKYHASLMLDRQGDLIVADIGSTNGTFVNGTRIAYGKVVTITERDKVRFGLVETTFVVPPRPAVESTEREIPDTETFSVGDFEFTTRMETVAPAITVAANIPETARPANDLAPATVPSIEDPAAEPGPIPIAPQPQLTSDSIEIKEDEIEIDIP